MPLQPLQSVENCFCFLFKTAGNHATSLPWCWEQANAPHPLAGLTSWGSAPFVKYHVDVSFADPPAFCEQRSWFWPSSLSLWLTCFASTGRKVHRSLENWCLIVISQSLRGVFPAEAIHLKCFIKWFVYLSSRKSSSKTELFFVEIFTGQIASVAICYWKYISNPSCGITD